MSRYGENSFLFCVFCMLIAATTIDCAQQKDVKCKEGSRWKDQCNWCWCGKDETFAACTLIGCINWRDDGTSKQCEGDAEWKKVKYVDKDVFPDICYWCKCVDERAVCDEIDCGTNF